MKKYYYDKQFGSLLEKEKIVDEITTLEDFQFFIETVIYYSKFNDYEYANLSTDILRKHFGTKYVNKKQYKVCDEIVKKLVNAGLLVKDNSYSTAKNQTKKYWLTQKFIDTQSVEAFELLHNERTRNNEVRVNVEFLEHPQYTLLQSDRVELDTEAFVKIHTMFTDDNKKFLTQTLLLTNFMSKRIFFAEYYGRIYNNFTNLSKEARHFIKIDGEYLEDVDLKSASFCLLYKLLSDVTKDKSYPLTVEQSAQYFSELVKLKKIIFDEDIYIDFLNYYKATNNNDGYITYDNKFISLNDREDAKIEGSRWLNSKTDRGVQHFGKYFKAKFPSLYEYVKHIKTEHNKKDSLFCQTLFKMESDIFVEVANKYAEEGGLSLHDGIYFKPALRERIVEDLKIQLEKLEITEYKIR